MTLMSMSSAPSLAAILQLALIGWDRVTGQLRHKWAMLVVLIAVPLLVGQIALPHGLVGFVIENISYDPVTGWARTEIFHYGFAEALRHPIFRIGFGEWLRPWWRGASVDNFWLLMAMRYGFPALLFLWIGLGLHLGRSCRAGACPSRCGCQLGYVFARPAAAFVLCTVHIWGATAIFIMTYIGAGAWIYTGPETAGRTCPGGRTSSADRRQARAAATGPARRQIRLGDRRQAQGRAHRAGPGGSPTSPARRGPIEEPGLRDDQDLPTDARHPDAPQAAPVLSARGGAVRGRPVRDRRRRLGAALHGGAVRARNIHKGSKLTWAYGRSASPAPRAGRTHLPLVVMVGIVRADLLALYVLRFSSARAATLSSRLLRDCLHQPLCTVPEPAQRRSRQVGADGGRFTGRPRPSSRRCS